MGFYVITWRHFYRLSLNFLQLIHVLIVLILFCTKFSVFSKPDVRMGESSTLEFPTTIMKSFHVDELSYVTAKMEISSDESNTSSNYSDAVMASQSASIEESSDPILAPLATEDEIELQEPNLSSPS